MEQFTTQERIDLGLSILARHEFEIYFDILKHQIIDRSMAEVLIGKAERLEDAVRVNGLEGFNVVAKRYERGSMVLTRNLPFTQGPTPSPASKKCVLLLTLLAMRPPCCSTASLMPSLL